MRIKQAILNDIAKQACLKLRQAMLISGNTPASVDQALGHRKGWLRKKLARPLSITLNDISDISLACRCEARVTIRDSGSKP